MKQVHEALLGLFGDDQDRGNLLMLSNWLSTLDADDAHDALVWLNGLSKTELKSFASLPDDQKTAYFKAHKPPKVGLTARFQSGLDLVRENSGLLRRIDNWCAARLAERQANSSSWFGRLNPFKW